MSGLTPNQWTILEALKDGPRWRRSFQTVKPLYEDLLKRGLIEGCRPHMGRARNMIRLTPAGCALLEIDPATVPLEIKAPVLVKKPARTLGPISPDSSELVRKTCEAFLKAIGRGASSGEAVAKIAALYDVQRPAIWRRLRSGGVIAPYVRRQNGGKGRPVGGGNPGYSAARRERSLAHSAETHPEPSPDQFVDRDACPRCGVRADIGCRHSRAPIGMLF